MLKPDGSLFLNVGARPSDPWTALDVAQAARAHLRLQNIIHWVKSIAIDQDSAGAAAGLTRDLAVGHYKPINSDRFLNDCHEFVFHFTPSGATRLDRLALGVPYQDQSNIAAGAAAADGVRCRGNTWFIPYETIQRRDRDRPHPATFPSRLPEQCLRLHGLSRIETGDGSVHRARQHRRRVRPARRELHRLGYRRDVSGRSGRADARRLEAQPRCPAVDARGWRRRTETRATAASSTRHGVGRLGACSTYSLRENTFAPLRVTFTSICRRRLVASGLFE